MATNNTTDLDSYGMLGPFIGEPMDQAARAAFVVIGSVMILSGVIGNASLIAVVVKHFLSNRKRNLHDLFIINLVLHDFLTSAYTLPNVIVDVALGYHPVADGSHCTANALILAVLYAANIESHISISFNRYLHVCHNYLYRRVFTLPRTACWCLFVWPFSVLLALPPIWGGAAGTYNYNPTSRICSYSRKGVTYPKVIVIVYSIMLPFFITYFNFCIFRFWRNARMSFRSRYPLVKEDQKKKRNLVAKWRAWIKRKKRAVPGFLPVDSSLGQEVQLQNSPEFDVQAAHDDAVKEQTDTYIQRTDKELVFLTTAPGTETSHAPIKDGAGEKEATTPNSRGLQIKENATDDESGDSETDDSHSEDSASDDKSEKQRTKEDACISSNSNTEDSVDSSELLDQTETVSETIESISRNLADETKSERDDKRVDNKSCSAGSTSASASPPSAVPTSSRKPQHRPSSKRGKQQTKNQQIQLRKKSQAREEAFVRSLLVVCVLTFIVFVPYTVLVIVDSRVKQPVEVHMAVNLMLFLNNAVNWIVYGAMNPAFKNIYVKYVGLALKVCRRVNV